MSKRIEIGQVSYLRRGFMSKRIEIGQVSELGPGGLVTVSAIQTGVPVVYMAHPVSPDIEAGETVASNLAAAKRWLRALEERYPELVFIAPWITECEIWDDSNPDERAAGLARCHVVIRRCCDQFWSVGPRMSSGMTGESKVALGAGKFVADFTGWSLS